MAGEKSSVGFKKRAEKEKYFPRGGRLLRMHGAGGDFGRALGAGEGEELPRCLEKVASAHAWRGLPARFGAGGERKAARGGKCLRGRVGAPPGKRLGARARGAEKWRILSKKDL